MGNAESTSGRLCSIDEAGCFGVCNPKSEADELLVTQYDITFADTSARETPAVVKDGKKYGLGILWLVRSEKLIVCGFVPGSTAQASGVRCGDILKSVNNFDVLHLISEKGRHPAGEYMIGDRNSVCELELLRVFGTTSDSSSENTQIQVVKCEVTRHLPAQLGGSMIAPTRSES